MSEPTTIAAPSAPSPATTQPASPTPGVGSAKTVTVGTPRDKADSAANVFGGTAADPWNEQVASEQQNAPSEGPGLPGHPAGEGEAAGADADPSQQPSPGEQPAGEQPPTLPGDDVLAELTANLGITAPAATKPAAGSPPPQPESALSDDEFEKRINPDGSTPIEKQLENARNLAKNAQSLIGRHAQEIGQYRKAMADINQHFTVDPATGKAMPKAKSLVALSQAIPAEEMEAALAEAGLRVVPKDWKGDPAVDDGEAHYKAMLALAGQMIPGDELSAEEKLAEIQSDPKRNARLNATFAQRIAAETTARQVAEAARQQQTAAATERQTAEEKQMFAEYFGRLKTLPYFEAELKPALQHWHNQFRQAGYQLKGQLLLDVMHRLAQASRVPGIAKDVREKAFKAGQADAMQKLGLGALPGDSVPTHVDGQDGQRGGSITAAQRQRAASVFG